MKQASDEPTTSTGKRARSRLFTVQQVMQTLADSDSDEAEFDQDYALSSDTDTESEQSSASDNEDRPRSSGSGSTTSRSRSRMGRVPQTADSGDGFVDDGWSRNFAAPTVDLNFNEDGNGPVNLPGSLTEESSCVDFLSLFADENFWQNLTAMTNSRAHQTLAAKPNNYYAKLFKDATVAEMKAFIGLRIYMEYLCIKPSYRDYWTNEGQDFLGFTPGYRSVMTRDRFFALWTFLHVMDEEDTEIDKTDKIYKVRPFLEHLLPKFRHYYRPKQYLSLDEGMIPTKNRLAIKQYLKDKPTKWGIKSFLLCEGDTGYIVNADIYTGAVPMPVPELGAVGNTVIRLLTCGMENQSHVLAMDRYYNSVTLSKYALTELQTGIVGTLMQNRKHFPVSLKSVKKLARGDSRYLCKNSVTCMVWQDKKPITFISNFHDPEQTGVATRRNKDGTLLEITMPQLVKDYNLYMGGCDKNDQMTRLHRSRRHYRWPRRLFIKIFMWACYNSYVLYLSKQDGTKKKPIFHKVYLDTLLLS